MSFLSSRPPSSLVSDHLFLLLFLQDDHERKFKAVEQGCDKLVKDAKVFRDAVLCESSSPSSPSFPFLSSPPSLPSRWTGRSLLTFPPPLLLSFFVPQLSSCLEITSPSPSLPSSLPSERNTTSSARTLRLSRRSRTSASTRR